MPISVMYQNIARLSRRMVPKFMSPVNSLKKVILTLRMENGK